MAFESLQFNVCVCSALLLAAAGCGGSESPKVLSREKAVNQLETKFTRADDRVKKQIDIAAAALKEKKYDVAFAALESVKADRTLTPDQLDAIHSAMQVLQNALAAAIVAGAGIVTMSAGFFAASSSASAGSRFSCPAA